MTEREPSHEPPGVSWREFVARLPESDHARLLVALGAGLQEARLASQIATQNGRVDEARSHVATALAHLTDALNLLQPPEIR